MKRLCVLGLVLVASCATEAEQFTLPDGRIGYTAICNGNWSSMADCYQVASEFCGGPYEVIDQEQMATLGAANGVVAPIRSRNMQFTCDVPKPKTKQSAG